MNTLNLLKGMLISVVLFLSFLLIGGLSVIAVTSVDFSGTLTLIFIEAALFFAAYCYIWYKH